VAPSLFFEQGSLGARLAAVAEKALASGALQPLATDYGLVEEGGITFLVRVLASLARKDEDARQRRQSEKKDAESNPFLPYEEDLFVSDLTKTHVALLNKFNVIERHLLVVTREFVPQDEYPGEGDLAALLAVMAEYESLGFYNGGTVAGASQSHKHLQVVPLPFREGDGGTPVDEVIAGARWDGAVGFAEGLPFLHAVGRVEERWFADPVGSAPAALGSLHALLQAVGMEGKPPAPGRRHSRPYNLLMTRRWMLLVPRSREFFDGASVNALGFAGALLVRSAGEMEKLKREGPLKVLTSVSFPPAT
jgi:ATP adenylyltransferase